jgi:hypothetical protein
MNFPIEHIKIAYINRISLGQLWYIMSASAHQTRILVFCKYILVPDLAAKFQARCQSTTKFHGVNFANLPCGDPRP